MFASHEEESISWCVLIQIEQKIHYEQLLFMTATNDGAKFLKPGEILHWCALNILCVEFQSEENKQVQEVKECKISA